MVFGVRLFCVANCADHLKPQTILQEQTLDIFVDRNSLHGSPDAIAALHSPERTVWLQPAVPFLPPAYRGNRDGLHHFSGNREEDFLLEG